MFFVISGYLITRILLNDDMLGRFSLIGFYQRRCRRIIPALLIVLMFSLAAGALLLSIAAYRELAATTAATLLFMCNFAFLKLSGYFDGGAEYKPLLHTWSLAVEEQFYIFFPILLYLLQRFACRITGVTLIGLALLSLGSSIWLSNTHPNAAFYLASTRSFEMLIGGIVAYNSILLSLLGQMIRDWLSLLGLILIVVSITLIDETFAFPGAIALVPCLGTALIISAGENKRPSIGGRLISSAAFVFFGNFSYSLYLWHWPLLAFAKNWTLGPLHPLVKAAVVVSAILIAYASWRWIERPFIRGLPDIRAIRISVAAIAAVGAICTAIYLLHGIPQRFGPESQKLFAANEDYNHRRPYCHSDAGEPISYDKNCVFGFPDVEPSVAIWADSHGAELAIALGERLAQVKDAVMQITASACPPVIGYNVRGRPNCARHNNEIARRLATDTRIDRVVILANFSNYPVTQRADFEQGFEAAIRALTIAGKQVIIYEPIPVFDYDPPAALGLIASRGGDPYTWGLSEKSYREKNAPFVALISRVAIGTDILVVHTGDILCQNGLCPALSKEEGVLYFDETHLSVTGARRLVSAMPLVGGCSKLELNCNKNPASESMSPN